MITDAEHYFKVSCATFSKRMFEEQSSSQPHEYYQIITSMKEKILWISRITTDSHWYSAALGALRE